MTCSSEDEIRHFDVNHLSMTVCLFIRHWIRCTPFGIPDLPVQDLQFTLFSTFSPTHCFSIFQYQYISVLTIGSGEPSGAQGNQRERWFSYIFDFSNVGFTQQTFEVVSRGLEFFKRGSVERLSVRLLTWDLGSLSVFYMVMSQCFHQNTILYNHGL